MTINDILGTTLHRPYELPSSRWKYYQEWNDAVFLHWQVDKEILQKFIPKGIEIDCFEGKAWVSLVAFAMEKIRPKYLPSFSPISNFYEINIRTYVKGNDKQGVYFLSMEGSKTLSCSISKNISKLPYRYSNIVRHTSGFKSINKPFNEYLNLKFSIGKDLTTKSGLDRWLTERYALFLDEGNDIHKFEVHHKEWPINEVSIGDLQLDYPRFKGLINNAPDKVHYSKGVKVVAWGKELLQ